MNTNEHRATALNLFVFIRGSKLDFKRNCYALLVNEIRTLRR